MCGFKYPGDAAKAVTAASTIPRVSVQLDIGGEGRVLGRRAPRARDMAAECACGRGWREGTKCLCRVVRKASAARVG